MSARLIPRDAVDLPAHRTLKVGLLGCGVVGSSVARALLTDRDALAQAAGADLALTAVVVRHPDKQRSVDLPRELIATDALAVAIDPDIDIVVEVIGGIEPAMASIKAALADNKSVVTANKELLAGAGADLLGDPDADLHFEASVGGAIPIIRTLKDSCSGDSIEGFRGIFSGTCNFVLSRMSGAGSPFEVALAEAQRRGFAESDPSADVEGWDAAAKVAILARIAFGIPATIEDVTREGISDISRARIAQARSEGLVCKLVGRGRLVGDDVELSVRPEFIARDDALAQVEGVDNAVVVETRKAGRLTFQGAGAGGNPTASAVLGDLVIAARRRIRARRAIPCVA